MKREPEKVTISSFEALDKKIKATVEELTTKTKEMFIEIGVCPDCHEVMQHSIHEPISSCSCGCTEDYGLRPLQALQRLNFRLNRQAEIKFDFDKFTKLHEDLANLVHELKNNEVSVN
ncbi:MAG: hypothetical protein WC967_13175 [Balneolaceae bacterium]